MKARFLIAVLALLLPIASLPSITYAQPAPGVEVMTRGPVHEAYAEPMSLDPGPTAVVSQPPPEAIEEMPPDERPEGDNVAWIPGYWAWDEGQNNYIWVSGVWRSIPPGREWVPGYWNQTSGGFRWVPGYWADLRSQEVTYLPEPPETLDEGPNVPAPNPEFVWIPGSWIWHHGRYAWRPGYWQRANPDWMWVPGHYVWTPRGYVYAGGYWDYDLERRGVLFAPVYVQPDVYRRRGFVYSPSVVIQIGGFVANLFLRPDDCHYYFGDYYDAGYRRSGFVPWHEVGHYRGGYDPIWVHERYVHRDDHDWDRRIVRDYEDRRDHPDRRPPKTFEALRALAGGHGGNADRNVAIAAAFNQFAQRSEGSMRFKKVAENDRKSLAQKGQELLKFVGERRQMESGPAVKQISAGGKGSEPAAVKLPRSVISSQAKAPASLPQVQAPPQPDTKVQPAPKKRGNFAEEARKGNTNGPAKPPLPRPADSKDLSKGQPQPIKPTPTKPEPKPEPKPQPERHEPKPAPKPEPKPEPKPAPHQEPKPAPKPEPRPEPKPAPHPPEKQPEKKPEPKPAPHPEKPPEKKPEHEPKDPNKP